MTSLLLPSTRKKKLQNITPGNVEGLTMLYGPIEYENYFWQNETNVDRELETL